MLRIIRSSLLVSFSILLIDISWADTQTNQMSAVPHYQTITVYCPPIADLKKDRDPNKMTWSAVGGWKSYTASFVNNIRGFIGARWIGANIGRLGCYYRGEESYAFPVILIYHTMTLLPQTPHWRPLSFGDYICRSNQQKQCPFLVRLRPKPENIYEEAEKLKYNGQ